MNNLQQYYPPAQAMPAPLAGPIINSGPRTLHFSSGKWGKKKGKVITDSDTVTVLYTITHRSAWSMSSSKPHVTITRASDNLDIGTIKLHSFTPTELSIHGRTVLLEKSSFMSRSRTFQSAALGGATLTWKYDSVWKESVTCSDQNNQQLARYKPSKGGRLELAGPAAYGALMDELVVSAVGMVQEAKRRKRTADATDAASSGAAAAAGG